MFLITNIYLTWGSSLTITITTLLLLKNKTNYNMYHFRYFVKKVVCFQRCYGVSGRYRADQTIQFSLVFGKTSKGNCSLIYSNGHTHEPTHTHTNLHTYTHTHTKQHTHTHTYTHTKQHTHVQCACTHTHYVSVRTHTHTHNAHTHTHREEVQTDKGVQSDNKNHSLRQWPYLSVAQVIS